jgi:hypothetical protein
MACNKPNCCRKAKAVETKLNVKATASLQEEITSDFYRDDKSLAELIEKVEKKEEDEDIS